VKKNINYYFYIIILIVMLDCTCYRSRVAINEIILDIPSSFNELASYEAKQVLQIEIQRKLNGTNNFKYDENVKSAHQLKIILSSPHGEGANKNILMTALLSRPQDNIERTYQAWVDVPLIDGELRKDEFLKSLSSILNSLYRLRMKGAVNNDEYIEKIKAKLKGDKISQTDLLNAIAILQEVKDKKSLDSMIELLKSTDDLLVGNALIMALGDIGEEEGMPAIIEFVERKPAIIRRQAIIAARNIASKLAAEWLLVMAYGHDDPVVKQEAWQALLEVEKKLGLKNE
jgi:hypothetical protein